MQSNRTCSWASRTLALAATASCAALFVPTIAAASTGVLAVAQGTSLTLDQDHHGTILVSGSSTVYSPAQEPKIPKGIAYCRPVLRSRSP